MRRSKTSAPRMRCSAQMGTQRQERMFSTKTEPEAAKRASAWASTVTMPARACSAASMIEAEWRGGAPGGRWARGSISPFGFMSSSEARSARIEVASASRIRGRPSSRPRASASALAMAWRMATWRWPDWGEAEAEPGARA